MCRQGENLSWPSSAQRFKMLLHNQLQDS
uniref:Uncharacterized protein n=1 Tax=Anguilla anguilla TaxID=7936 RepID=A0A0E9PCW3_ANGAN